MRSGSLFSNISIEGRIPASHPLRPIRKLAHQALDRLNPTFSDLYASEGRQPVPPAPLLKDEPAGRISVSQWPHPDGHDRTTNLNHPSKPCP